jgi:P27 family predicted phage terminase small subunit
MNDHQDLARGAGRVHKIALIVEIFRMARGKKAKPTALRILQGNPSKRPLPQGEPQPDPSMPVMPEGLSVPAQEEWLRLSPLLHNMGVLTSADGAALAALCRQYARHIEAEAHLNAQGVTIASPKGHAIASPYVAISHGAFDRWYKLLGDFGLTPSSRSKLVTPGLTPSDDLQTFIKRKS